MSTSLPTVSLADYTHGSPEARAGMVRTLSDSLGTLGFCAVTDHGVGSHLIHEVYGAMHEVFAQSEAEKLMSVAPSSMGNRGYVGRGKEHAKGQTVGDLKEFWHVGRELPELGASGKNAWPAHAVFRSKATELYAELDASALTLLRAIAVGLGLPEQSFSDMVEGGNSILRMIHYPPLRELYTPGAERSAAHEDINMLTLLCESTHAGLELLGRDGHWTQVATPPGHLIVDTGDMMQRVTGGRMRSTTHRVVNPATGDTPRYSIPFFAHPRPDCVLAALCTPLESFGRDMSPISARDFLSQRLQENGLQR